jgi:predicted nuclease of predicted toxin-antitoxin system
MKLLADENLDNTIIRGLLRRNPIIDILRVQDVGLSGVDDPAVLAWAADDNRILLTHDVATITRYAYERVATNLPCLILDCSTAEDLDGQIYYIPL